MYAMSEVETIIPTIGFVVKCARFKGLEVVSWDVGGRSQIRALWRHYYQNSRACIFVVDSNDRDRVSEASEELNKLLLEDELKNIPVLVATVDTHFHSLRT